MYIDTHRQWKGAPCDNKSPNMSTYVPENITNVSQHVKSIFPDASQTRAKV